MKLSLRLFYFIFSPVRFILHLCGAQIHYSYALKKSLTLYKMFKKNWRQFLFYTHIKLDVLT